MSTGLPDSAYLLRPAKPCPKWLPGDRMSWGGKVLGVAWRDGAWIYDVEVIPAYRWAA